ncbi:MAG: hypothetical protein Q4C73_11740 [Eubacteriales bacterium]|nr:hypothetical protein [Eubacteriales bacterium]
MLQLLETGQALYVLAGICVLGILTRALTRHFYKRLTKESTNLTLTKNKCLRELRQRAENTYRMNQGMRDSGAWLEHQLYEIKAMGIPLPSWSSLCVQWTWLCLLAGGAGAFLSYWYRLDTFYIVLYGGGSVMMAMLTMLFDNGTAGGWREQLLAALQDHLENVMYPRMARNLPADGGRAENGGQERPGLRTISGRGGRMLRGARGKQAEQMLPETGEAAGLAGADGMARTDMEAVRGDKAARMNEDGILAAEAVDRGQDLTRGGGAARKGTLRGRRGGMMEDSAPGQAAAGGISRDVDYLKRSLEQIAASREKGTARAADENWLKDLRPEEVELIGDILKQYLA